MNKPKKAAVLAVLALALIGTVCAVSGGQILSAISGIKASDSPVITNAFLDKTKYVSGDQMLITASVEDNEEIKEVKAEIENENGIDTVKLNLIGGDDKKGTWQTTWRVHDVTGKKVYKTKVIAINSKERTSEIALNWIDPAPNPGHLASEVGGTTNAERTFNSADLYTFKGDIRIGEVRPANIGASGWGSLINFSGGPIAGDNTDYIFMGRYDAAADESELRVRVSDNYGGTDKDAFVVGFDTFPTTWTPVLRVQNNGNVGIGTSSPWYGLHVNSGAQGIISISGASDDGHTYSALYLHDDTADLTNNWVFAHKKETGNSMEDDLHIARWTGAGTGRLDMAIDSVTGDVTIGANLNVGGTLTKGGGAFLIDHPLDPENKILQHSFMESPDMKNIYDGIAIMDKNGEAIVKLPDYFEALNKDYRYQITPIGAPAALYILYIKEEIKDNQFVIAGGKKGTKASWQVTGIRQDAFAKKNPIIVEQEKGIGNDCKKGEYIYPDAFRK